MQCTIEYYFFENCAVLGYYAASSGNFLPTFWDNLPVPPSTIINLKSAVSIYFAAGA
jgi:hypothetical protein